MKGRGRLSTPHLVANYSSPEQAAGFADCRCLGFTEFLTCFDIGNVDLEDGCINAGNSVSDGVSMVPGTGYKCRPYIQTNI